MDDPIQLLFVKKSIAFCQKFLISVQNLLGRIIGNHRLILPESLLVPEQELPVSFESALFREAGKGCFRDIKLS